MDTPRVSVLVAAYNPRYLFAALSSINAQTSRDLEIIIRDDCPSDAVADVVRAFAAQCDLPLDYQKNEAQLGVRRNYERCFASARGQYIKFLNDDDTLDPRCLERLSRALDDNPDAHLATSHRRAVDARGSPLDDSAATHAFFVSDALIEGVTVINALLLLCVNFIGEPSTALFRRAAIHDDEPLFDFLGDPGRGLSDIVLWCKLAQRGPVAFLSSRLSSFRIHAEQRQTLAEVKTRSINSFATMREKWLALGHHLDCPPNVLRATPLPIRSTAAVGHVWQHVAIPAFTPRGSDVVQLLSDWRARRHPFFAVTGSSKAV